LITKIW